jgi:hypothetical protein
MPSPFTTIQINDVSGYLAANAVARGSLFSPALNPKLPLILYMEGKALSWGYEYTADDLQSVANYVYAMDYQSGYAQRIVDGGGGGAITPVNPGIPPPAPLDFEVSGSSYMGAGAITVSIPSFIGYNVDFFRGGIAQNTTDLGDGSSFYTWGITSGLFSIFGAAQTGELFRIVPSR